MSDAIRALRRELQQAQSRLAIAWDNERRALDAVRAAERVSADAAAAVRDAGERLRQAQERGL
ncbi:MAG: hypothetical protein IT554_01025 [Sphingomonadaceae bacterium]|nr:hypothetical protein [Sphingomonadaceae bacterium]